MPIIRVEMYKGRDRAKKRALVEALTDAFIRTCGSTPDQVHIVLTEVDKEDWGSGGQLAVDKSPG